MDHRQTEYELEARSFQSMSKIKITRIIGDSKTRFQIRFEDAKKASLTCMNRPQRVCYLSHKFASLYTTDTPKVNILGWSLDENNNSTSKQLKLNNMLNKCDLKYKQDSFIECSKSSKSNLVLYALLDLIARKINAQLQHKPLVSKLKQLLAKEALISRELFNHQNKLSDSFAFAKLHCQQTVFTVFNEINFKYYIKNTTKMTRRFEPKQIEFDQAKFEKDLNDLTTFIMNVLIRVNLYNQKVCADFQAKHKYDKKYVTDLMRKNELFAKFLNCFNYSNFLNDSDLSSDELKSHELYKSVYDSLLVQSELIISSDSLNDMNTKYMNTELQVWFEYFELAKLFYKHFNDLKLLEEDKLISSDYNLFTFAIEFKLFMIEFLHALKLESMLLDELISCALSPIKVLIDLSSNVTSADPRKIDKKASRSVDLDLISFNNSKKKASPSSSNLDESIEIKRANETLVKYKLKAELVKLNESELEQLLTLASFNNQPTAYLTPMSSPLNNLIFNTSNQTNCLESQISASNLIPDNQLDSIDLSELMNIDFESFEIGILKTSTQNTPKEKSNLKNISNTEIIITNQDNSLNSIGLLHSNEESTNITNLEEQESSIISRKDFNQFIQPIEFDSQQIGIYKQMIDTQAVEAPSNENFSEILEDCEAFLSSNSCVQTNDLIASEKLELNEKQANYSIDDLNTKLGGKPILKIIPRSELETFPLETSVDVVVETNASKSPAIELKEQNLNLNEEKLTKFVVPSRNLLKSSILSENEPPRSEESFQEVKDSLKQAASNLNKKMKNSKETPPNEDKKSTDNNKSNYDNPNEIVFFKIFEFNKNEIKSSKRSLKFSSDPRTTSQKVPNFDEFKLSIREASTPQKPVNAKTDELFSSRFKQFIKKPRNTN